MWYNRRCANARQTCPLILEDVDLKRIAPAVFLIVLFVVNTNCSASPASPAPVPGTKTPSASATIALPPLLEATVAPTATATRRPTSAIDLEKLGKVDRDVTYCNAADIALKMDLYHPVKVGDSPAPVAVNVHGGSWSFGDKRNSETMIDIPELVGRGYFVVAVDYRLAPMYRFPAQIEDVKCAVRYLRANASQYNLDPNRIGAWGCSAGGNLVAMLGLTDGIAEFEGSGGYPQQSSRVQAVVAMSAPADFMLTSYNSTHDRVFARVFGAASNTDPILVHFSPVSYVSKNAPPFFVLGGDKDDTVPIQQSEELARRLNQVGASANLQIVKNAHHCLPDNSPPMEPSRAAITQMIADFFDRELR